jgi:hypothetical protein
MADSHSHSSPCASFVRAIVLVARLTLGFASWQFAYGEDGMDATFLETQKPPTLDMRKKDLKEHFEIDAESPDFAKLNLPAHLKSAVVKDLELRARLREEFETICKDQKQLRHEIFADPSVDAAHFPVNFERLIKSAQREFRIHQVRVVNVTSRVVNVTSVQ